MCWQMADIKSAAATTLSVGLVLAGFGSGGSYGWNIAVGGSATKASASVVACVSGDEKQLGTDVHGDPLPPGAVARMGTVRFLHGSGVQSVAYAPDGKTVVSIGNDGVIRIWEVPGGKELRQLRGHKRFGSKLAISPDGKLLGSTASEEHFIRLWDLQTGRELRPIKGHDAEVSGITFTPDGTSLVSGSADKTVRFWDVTTGNEMRRLEGSINRAWSLKFSADGKILATGSHEDGAALWDAKAGKRIHVPGLPNKETSSIELSSDGKVLITNDPKRVSVWDIAKGRAFLHMGPKHGEIATMALSPNGDLLATAGWNEPLQLWHLPTISQLEPGANVRSTISLAFSADSKFLVTGGLDMRLRLWDTEKAELMSPVDDHVVGVQTTVLTPRGDKLATVAGNGEIYLWDTATQKKTRSIDLGREYIAVGLAAPDDKTLFSIGPDRSVRRWELDTGRLMSQIRTPGHFLHAVGVRRNGQALAAAWKMRTVSVVDASTGNEVSTFSAETGDHVTRATFAPGARYLAYLDQGDKRQKMSGDRTADLNVRDVVLAERIKTFQNRRPPFYSAVEFSADGRMLAIQNSDGPIEYCEMATGKSRFQIPALKDHYVTVTFSADGKTSAVGTAKGQIEVWDLTQVKQTATLEGHYGRIHSLAFASDGIRLFSGAEDGTALVWKLPEKARDVLKQVRLSDQRLAQLWTDLAETDAAKAYRAIWELSASPTETTAFLKDRVLPVSPPSAAAMSDWIAELDHDEFSRRDKAEDELRKLGEAAVGAFRKALVASPSVERRRRLLMLLAEATRPWDDPAPNRVRLIRAVEVLEKIGTDEAREVLQRLASGADGARLTIEAQAGLDYLKRRATSRP